MSNYKAGQVIKFKTPSGRIVEGTIYDCNEYALIVVNPIFGQYVIEHKDIVGSNIQEKSTTLDKDEWEYYAAYNGQVMGSPGHYSPQKNYPGSFGYLSPDVDDDGC